MANKKVFLDTNIVADLIDASRNGHKLAMQLLEKLLLAEYEICISEDMLSTLFYISNDKSRTLDFFENVIFIDWHVLAFGRDVIRQATKLAKQLDLDLEDLLQCFCAKKNSCEILISNDKKFHNCGLEIIGVEDFLKKDCNS